MSILGTVARVGAGALAGGEAGAVAGPWGAIAGTAGGILGSLLPEIIDAFRTAKTPEEAQAAVAPKLQAMVATLQARGMTHEQALAKANEAIQPELEAAAQGGDPMSPLAQVALSGIGILGGAYAGRGLAKSILNRAGGKGNATIGGLHGKSGASVATASESGTPLPNAIGAAEKVGVPEGKGVMGPFPPTQDELEQMHGVNLGGETREGPAYSGKGRGPAGQSLPADTENMPTADEAMQETREVAQEPEQRGFQLAPPDQPWAGIQAARAAPAPPPGIGASVSERGLTAPPGPPGTGFQMREQEESPWEAIQAARASPAPPPPLGGFSDERGLIPSGPEHALPLDPAKAAQVIALMRRMRAQQPGPRGQFVGAGAPPPL